MYLASLLQPPPAPLLFSSTKIDLVELHELITDGSKPSTAFCSFMSPLSLAETQSEFTKLLTLVVDLANDVSISVLTPFGVLVIVTFINVGGGWLLTAFATVDEGADVETEHMLAVVADTKPAVVADDDDDDDDEVDDDADRVAAVAVTIVEFNKETHVVDVEADDTVIKEALLVATRLFKSLLVDGAASVDVIVVVDAGVLIVFEDEDATVVNVIFVVDCKSLLIVAANDGEEAFKLGPKVSFLQAVLLLLLSSLLDKSFKLGSVEDIAEPMELFTPESVDDVDVEDDKATEDEATAGG